MTDEAGTRSALCLSSCPERPSMTRSTITLRVAEPGDAPVLTALWGDNLRKTDDAHRVADCLAAVDRAEASPDERLLVAVQDSEIVGAVYLIATELSPMNPEPMVQAIAPTVFPRFLRRGVGAVLMDAAVTFAEERGIGCVAAAAPAGSRDGTRFLARLTLTPVATLRLATTASIRGRLMAMRPVANRASGASRHT